MATGGDDRRRANQKSHKTRVYRRSDSIEEESNSLEGMVFPGEPAPPPTTGLSKKKPVNEKQTTSDPSSFNPPLGSNAEGDNSPVDLKDLPERLSDVAGLGNMPELTLLLEDDDVIDRFEDKRTAWLLREISMDPSMIEEIKKEPEIIWMLNKIEEKKWLVANDPEVKKKLNKT